MSAYELTCWQKLESIEPWGEKRADYRAAILAWTMASCFAAKGKQPKLERFLKLFDFEPQADQAEQSDADISFLFDQINAATRSSQRKRR